MSRRIPALAAGSSFPSTAPPFRAGTPRLLWCVAAATIQQPGRGPTASGLAAFIVKDEYILARHEEAELCGDDFIKDWPEARLIPEVTRVPVAVVIAAPPNRLNGNGAAMMRLQIKHQSEWALKSVNGLILVSGRVGHVVQRDDPALVVQAVKHALTAK